MYKHINCGKLPDFQSERLLIKTIGNRLTETTNKLIYQAVNPLTRQGVSDRLKEYKLRNVGFSTAASQESKTANVALPTVALSPPGQGGQSVLRKGV